MVSGSGSARLDFSCLLMQSKLLLEGESLRTEGLVCHWRNRGCGGGREGGRESLTRELERGCVPDFLLAGSGASSERTRKVTASWWVWSTVGLGRGGGAGMVLARSLAGGKAPKSGSATSRDSTEDWGGREGGREMEGHYSINTHVVLHTSLTSLAFCISSPISERRSL